MVRNYRNVFTILYISLRIAFRCTSDQCFVTVSRRSEINRSKSSKEKHGKILLSNNLPNINIFSFRLFDHPLGEISLAKLSSILFAARERPSSRILKFTGGCVQSKLPNSTNSMSIATGGRIGMLAQNGQKKLHSNSEENKFA